MSTLEEKYRKALEVLVRYEQWEADSLNSYGESCFDNMSDKEYNDWMAVQALRAEVLTRARLENIVHPSLVTQDMVNDAKFSNPQKIRKIMSQEIVHP